MNGLPDHDPLAAELEAAGTGHAELQRQLGEARSDLGDAVRRALGAGASYRWIAARAGLTLGAVQRLAGDKTAEPSRRAPSPEGGAGGTDMQGARDSEASPPVVIRPKSVASPPTVMVCVRVGCRAAAVDGRRFCARHP